MQKVLITGASGLLGGNLVQLLPTEWELVGIVHAHRIRPPKDRSIRIVQHDLCNEDDISSLKSSGPFDAIIHTAALTNVDACEQDKELAHKMNAELSEKMAQWAAAMNAHLVHISTDQVFNGTQGNYKEDNPVSPVNEYARSKCEAERRIRNTNCKSTIVRTNLFGFDIQEKHDFAGWILDSLDKGQPLQLVTDVRFSVLLANALVRCIQEILERDITGTLHIGASDYCTKHEFGMHLARIFQKDQTLISASSIDDLALMAPRPKNMSLNTSYAQSILNTRLPKIMESIDEYKKLMDNGYPKLLKTLASS